MGNNSEPRFGRQDAATPFRPMVEALAEVPTRTYRVRANRLEVKLENRRSNRVAYSVTPLSCDPQGAAFRLSKMDGSGESFDVLLGSGYSSCMCDEFSETGKACVHVKALQTLLELGILTPAPGSAAGDAADQEGGGGGRAA